MLTKRLYWENPYQKEFKAKIIALKQDGVVLDQTLFYPKSGGQASDRGNLKSGVNIFEVDYTFKKDNEIIHHMSSDFQNTLKIGMTVTGTIDWEYRYGLMKAHSSQHIFSAIILDKYDIETLQVYLESEEVILNLEKKLSYEQLNSALQKINDICTVNNHKIVAKIISFKEAEILSDKIRGDIPNEDQIRLIQVENCDLICCGGTHVDNSIEIGPLLIVSFKKNREIRYVLGKKAVDLLSDINIDLLSSANLLGETNLKLKLSIEKNLNLISNLQQENRNLIINLLNMVSQIPSKIIKNIPIYLLKLDIDNKILNKEFKTFPTNSLLIINTENNRIKVLSKGQHVNANEIIEFFIGKYGGKGGGSNQSAQALLNQDPNEILSDIESYLNEN